MPPAEHVVSTDPRPTFAEYQARLRERIRSAPPGTFVGVPGWFRGHCGTARRGGESGYSQAGFHLGLHLYETEPYDTEPDAWAELIAAELLPAVRAGDDPAALAWLVRRFPACLALVPVRRRDGFLAGFVRGLEHAEGGAR